MLEKTDRKIDILRPVANRRKIIMFMNRDKSLTLVTVLSSVSRRRSVSSSSRGVRISTVNDSARNVWSQNVFRVCMRCLASRKFSSSSSSSGLSNTWAICSVMVSIRPSVCSARSLYSGEACPSSGFVISIFCIFLSASTLRDGSLLRILEIVIVMSLAILAGASS